MKIKEMKTLIKIIINCTKIHILRENMKNTMNTSNKIPFQVPCHCLVILSINININLQLHCFQLNIVAQL